MTLALNVSRSDFLTALAALQNITGKKGTLAVLANILFETDEEGLVMTATDLEVGIRCRIPAEILAAGSITLPARKLFELVKESEESHLHLEEQDNKWVKISAESSDCRLSGISADEFPSFPPYREDNLAAVPTALISELIDKTIYSVAHEGENNFNLAGILLEREILAEGNFLRMVSSDGHRMSMMEGQVETDLGSLEMDRVILIPKKGIQEIRKLCDEEETVFLGLEEKQAVVKAGGYTLVVRLMSGDFPDYKGIIKAIDKSKHISVDRRKMMHSLKRVNIFTEDRYNAVNFIIENNKITLSSQNMDYGSAREEVPAGYQGETMEIGFNGKYFYEALQVMASDKVKAYINSEESPCLLQGDKDPGYLSVIMPMKL